MLWYLVKDFITGLTESDGISPTLNAIPCSLWCGNACFGAQVSSKYGTWYSKRGILLFMCVGCWAGVTYLRYTVMTSPNKGETAVHCCDPALSVLVMLVSWNVFHVVSATVLIYCLDIFFWLIRPFIDTTLAAFYRIRSFAVYVILRPPRLLPIIRRQKHNSARTHVTTTLNVIGRFKL